MSIEVRRGLVERLHALYFRRVRPYTLNQLLATGQAGASLNNIDHRISRDLLLFSEHLQSFFGGSGSDNDYGIIINLICFVLFILYCFHHRESTVSQEFWLAVAMLMFVFLTVLMWSPKLMSPVSHNYHRFSDANGNFRHFHCALRMNLEPVAFYDGFKQEEIEVSVPLGSCCHNFTTLHVCAV
jgi:ABC-type uncharacterized transport system fused permease/ATPase subunit